MKKVCMALACVAAVFAVSYIGLNTYAQEAQITDCKIEDTYNYGDKFIMPNGKVSYKGKEKDAESKYLVFPSGKAKESDDIVLSEGGEYKVVYKAKFNGVVVSAEKSFVVNKSLLSVSSEKSSAAVVENKIDVSLASNDVFTYNKALDLSEASTDKPLFVMECSPNTIGTADVGRLIIRLTDVYDEENYVNITLRSRSGDVGGQIYIAAGASNQPQIGVENVEDPTKTKAHVNNIFGTPVSFSMAGTPRSSADTQLKIYFDYDNKALYVDREIYSGGNNRIIIDLDDATYFGNNLWQGFTTGKVKMTIYGENYKSTACNFSLASIYGQSDFGAAGDNEPPAIIVTSGYEDDSIPHALVGQPYKMFDAKALDDFDDEVNVVTSAYYKYYSATPIKLSVVDGAFTPEREGTYVIEYAATDYSGNIATKCIKVKAINGEGLQCEVKDAVAQCFTGEKVKVLSDVSYKDNSGNVEYSITVKNKSTEEEYEIDNISHEFCPMSDGEWKVTVTTKDYVSTVENSFILKANHTSQPQVYDSVGIQKHFILGATYELPSLNGYDFSSGKGVETGMSIYVTENGGEEKQLADNTYIPEKAGDVKICYRLTVDGKSCEKTYQATVVDVGYPKELSMDKYFVTTEGEVTAEKAATCVTYSTDSRARLEFVNFVQVKDFDFSFGIGEENKFNRVNVYLTDILTGKQVKLSYKRSGEGALFSINDGTEFAVDSSFEGMNRNFALEFNNDTHMLSASVELSLEVEKYLDGSKFEGFTESVALLAVEIDDVSGTSQLVINSINAQSINSTKVDRFAPKIVVATKAGDKGINEEVELTGAFAYDTLDPISTLSLVVTGPDNKVVKDINGVALDGAQDAAKDYTIKLTKYGDYTITYTATDGNGKSDEYIYTISSKDVIRPSVELKRHKTTAKQDATVKVAKVVVEDDITEKCKVNTYIINPEGVMETVSDGKFKATLTGVYTVRYIVFDESGNCTFASYEINVK